ncbi:BREX-6 system adenine-specific DNA-methyltransferase PglX [Corallococcus sicarius]|uniref:site-specific DNA-methyltransferase (adenine-specific) n=1 Tax=Corallococcus sicarius TaxID=2316726 RepID=A0A3A8NJW0_9BACT|nr:BREX-6 system adenine-specific DNA-methyltransferase PglX [Corallococcus sicarius]RKH44283.1 BREX-6 system adenine-specific DNA-methyltransferase PglX [Corallococcus sicarius]
MTSNTSARLTPESKAALRKTIRNLRGMLLKDLLGYAEQRYRLNVPFAKAGLSQAMREHRRRLESALAERAAEEGDTKEARERAIENAVKEAGATLLNRLVLIRHLEAVGLSRPVVVTGGWKSAGYQQFRGYAPGIIEDETQGYAILLQLLFDELAAQLPGLFGEVGLTSLFPASPATLRAVIEALGEVPAEAWQDDMTLGWVYQYWNDPDRETLDAKLHARGKLESHEIASKTQMFTERYMVEWLLHNSLGPTWLAMCRKNGWQAEVEQRGILRSLDERRAEWRKKREAGEVALDALMPIEGRPEETWKYYVPQPLPDDVVKHAPASIRELKLLDPACGSGHFLVVAFDVLVELYREESRHRGESWTDRQIAEWILENNLHGVDIDPRAVQIAAAAIFLKARSLANDASPRQVNLVAPALRLSVLDRKDPTLLKLERDIELETGIPPELTQQLLDVLAGVDYLGTLLKVGDAVDNALDAYRGKLGKASQQQDMFAGRAEEKRIEVTKEDAKRIVLKRLNTFLAKHSGEEDLGLRLRGQQLTAGLRFASIAREGEYHLVVANPPYQGTSRMKDAGYIARHYPRGKSDLYAAFLERGLELCRPGGASAMVTMRNWMFLSGFTDLRENLLKNYDLRIIGDVDRGAFDEVPNEILATAMSVFRRSSTTTEPSVAMQPTPLSDKSYDRNRTARKRMAVLAQVGRNEFRTEWLHPLPGAPLLYWWPKARVDTYANTPKLGESSPARFGLNSGNNLRFIRKWWEAPEGSVLSVRTDREMPKQWNTTWARTVKGSENATWFGACDDICRWHHRGLEVKVNAEHLYGTHTRQIRNEAYYFKSGLSFTRIGSTFTAGAHWFRSLIDSSAPSVYPTTIGKTLCQMNSPYARKILEEINPSIAFQVGDANRLPLLEINDWDFIYHTTRKAFEIAESNRETSSEFQIPGQTNWESIKAWAYLAVAKNASDETLPVAIETHPPEAIQALSFQIGVTLGRFDQEGKGRRIPDSPSTSATNGILFSSLRTRLEGPTCHGLLREWENRKNQMSSLSLEEWIHGDFFNYHRKIYENRPIYLPLSSARKSFIAFISVHSWSDATLSTLLAYHLLPEQRAIQGTLADLQTARQSPDRRIRTDAERSYVQHKKLLDELDSFIDKVQEIDERGPSCPDDKTERREADGPYKMDLDDGVMVNSAALWPLLEPMWKDPKKWWKELANAKGRKDYDWSHLAARYFPSRVEAKCRKDPSLAVAHGCFWKYYPDKAYQWELRLQDELGPDFKLDEKDADALRTAFLDTQPSRVRELEAAEQARRERKARKQDQEELDLSEAQDEEVEDDEAASA